MYVLVKEILGEGPGDCGALQNYICQYGQSIDYSRTQCKKWRQCNIPEPTEHKKSSPKREIYWLNIHIIKTQSKIKYII